MPRTETRDEPLREPTSAAAASSSSTLAPAQTVKRPWRDAAGKLIVDWKDVVVLCGATVAGGLIGARLHPEQIGQHVHGEIDDPWMVVGVLVGFAVPMLRRVLFGGPPPLVREGFAWGVARVVSGVSLFFGFFCGAFAAISAEAPMFTIALGLALLAMGATLDHLARQPPDRDP